MTLQELKVGQQAKVISFQHKEIESSFILFGMIPDSIVEIKRRVPFGGSLYISFNQTLMAIRRSEAEQVIVEII